MTATGSRHAELMDADGFWRQFVVAFYFDNPGDELVGVLVKFWREGTGDDSVPALRLQTKDGRHFDVTAHQERLKAELVKKAPVKGDWVKIVYKGEAERAAPGMSKAKLFTVEVRRPGSPPEAGAETVRGSAGSENEPRAGKTTP